MLTKPPDRKKLKRRARKGIPDCMRSITWPVIAEIKQAIPASFKGDKDKFFMVTLH